MDFPLEDFLRKWAAENMPSLIWDEIAFATVLLMTYEVFRMARKADPEATT